ncbi:RNA polymerase II elongation factor Ell isoform X2 [Uranotaenia lowii]|uniref:RNA polymerase II elongation factor Ell isoform X2 n=1 Tax=Uranotaenia lowii TaxID=190385 RepID=UPI00247A0999|nr:RNA polymerase II elongation factor Ell isoform X2 [Uranotaenia lowii]
MATLCAGHYGLSQQQQTSSSGSLHPGAVDAGNKELIFVKLTDSALRAIEEFQRNQSKLGQGPNPSIQFLSNGEGYLTFPSGGSNVQKFSFSITDCDGGAIECIQQNQGQQLQNMGHIPQKMRIHANDDVYETTKTRMAAFEEVQKNKCTREIKPNQTDIGRKVKLKNPTTRHIPSSNSVLSKRDSLHSSSNNSYNGNSALVNSSSSNSNNSLASSVPALGANNHHHNNNNSSNNNNNHSHLNGHSNGTSYGSNNLSTSPKLPKLNGLHSNSTTNGHSNSLSSQAAVQQPKPGYQHTIHDPPQQQQQQQPQQQKSENGVPPNNQRLSNGRTQHGKAPTTEIMKRSLRERLVHLLAVRPWKKPELYAKIRQDGVRPQEVDRVQQVLSTVASMKDNVYYLHRHIWNDVQEDWPFYSEQDRQILKRRKPQNLTPPLSGSDGGSSSGQSPSSAHNGNSPPPAGGKRPSAAANEDNNLVGSMPNSKKPRISHYKKNVIHPDISNRSNVTPNAQESEDSGVSLSFSLVSNDVARRIQHPNGGITAADMADVIVAAERDTFDQEEQQQQDTAYREEVAAAVTAVAAVPNKKPSMLLADDYTEQFTRITSVEQRRKYKTEFDNDFKEYRKLHETVDSVSRRFAQLEEDLKHQRHNERRYKEIQRQILREYDESIKDDRFQEIKKRLNYLHKKLSHIKCLVSDYDEALTHGHCRPQENY